MKYLSLTYSLEQIQRDVEEQSAIIAVTHDNTDGLLFDMGYETQFRNLFHNAQSRMYSAMSRYIITDDYDSMYVDLDNVLQNRDFCVVLELPDTFMHQISKAINTEVKTYIVTYILYRWFETKIPDIAVVFANRAEEHLTRTKRYIEMRTKRRIRPTVY